MVATTALALSGCSATAVTPPSLHPSATAATVAPAAPVPPASPSSTITCPSHPTVTASNSDQLEDALKSAAAGTVIRLAPTVFSGRFTLTASGTPTQPIWVCGVTGSIMDGGSMSHGYVLHLDGVANARLVGFSVRNGQKGVVADHTLSTVIAGLTVSGVGQEGIHLRAGSSGNTVEGNTVSDTGRSRAQFGEGIYIGSAHSNWCGLTACQPDHSDGNVVRGNTVSHTTAESVDIKEGTSGGFLQDNTFDGTGMTAADSWVDVKGNGWTIAGNSGIHTPLDGFQTHEVVPGWGTDNLFRDNSADVHSDGYGIHLAPPLQNAVACDNTATGAASGVSNITCSKE